jgi:hypothetical protein
MTMELSSLITANVLQQGVKGVEARVAAYGDPADYRRRRLVGADALLRAAGVYDGKPSPLSTRNPARRRARRDKPSSGCSPSPALATAAIKDANDQVAVSNLPWFALALRQRRIESGARVKGRT